MFFNRNPNNNNKNNNNSSIPNTDHSSSVVDTPIQTEAPANQDITFGDMVITLPVGFAESNNLIPEGSTIQCLYVNSDDNLVFGAFGEEKSLFEGTYVSSLNDYLNVQHDNAKGEASEIKEDNGLRYFDYTASNEGSTFTYFSTAFESDDEYYFVQFYTMDYLYSLYEDSFLNWAHTVRKA